jgi:3-oxoacyl-[acyl-carrier protein] reductase
MNLDLAGRAALVTGAGRGIGAAIARALAGEGCDVALVDLAASDSAEALACEMRTCGHRAIALRSDVTSLAAAEESVASTVREFGHLDILVCNAGIARDAAVWNMTEAAWDDVLAVNLKGCFTYARAVAPLFRNQRSGRIVTVASVNGLRGKFGQANYAASKGGLVALSKTLARELGPSGVTVNCVAPGMVRTELTATLPPAITDAAIKESVLGHIGEPDDVANLVTFLCSDRARHVTGTVIKVDGGQYV